MGRWINADELKQSIDRCDICNICPNRENFCSYDCDFPDAVTPKWEMLINAQPSIDIVRCKECKHTDGEPPIADGRSWCVLHGSFMYYCSDGEREGE